MAQACVTHTHTQAGVPKHPDMLTHSCLFIPTRGDHTLTVQLIHRDMHSHTQEALKGTDAHADTGHALTHSYAHFQTHRHSVTQARGHTLTCRLTHRHTHGPSQAHMSYTPTE